MNFDIDFKKIDLYELFDVLPDSTESDIKKAYRKKALIYHPDKNPDNPKANEVFQQLSKALEVLTDKKARETYDKILKAKKEREIKNRKLDAKRRKLKDDLDAKEKESHEISTEDEEIKLQKEIDRIRKEGSKQLEEENNLLKKKLAEQNIQIQSNRVKIRKKNKIILTEKYIRDEFSRFGTILFIIISKNNKSAILEYENYESLKQISANCPANFESQILSVNKTSSNDQISSSEKMQPSFPSAEAAIPSIIEDSQEDYEDFVLRRLQEVEKNKNKS